MSDTFIEKDNNNEVEAQSHSKTILDVKSLNLSERPLPDSRIVTSRKIYSAIQIESNVNYDDLCGSWVYPKNRVYSWYNEPPIPSVCIWQYFTKQDVDYLKKYQKNKEIVLFFFENKFAKECKTKSNDILLYELWEFFKFARLHSFRGKSISAVLGLVYLMHLFFLSHPWRSAKEIYEFFHEATLLHTVLVRILNFFLVL
ncbi:uncharacterized protein LOC128878178 [Hylaeus volcanicus]|uniref:uncharacterized protein LOC128878178 n=1 Tax=Hylaeus volcanicus TaxID=313075 RepID=UPI0023B7A294|nr:uncharacterized protein LOC128878178 [Hylaeus volcanicus]